VREQKKTRACRRDGKNGHKDKAKDQRKRSRPGTAKPQPKDSRNTLRLGLRLLVPGAFGAARGVVACPEGVFPFQTFGGAFDYTFAHQPGLGIALWRRRSKDPRALFLSRLLPKQVKRGCILNSRDTRGQHLQ
jgi:hypothetical protein